MAFFTELDFKQMKTAAFEMPECLNTEFGNLRKVMRGGNWEIYHNQKSNYLYAIAKPTSGSHSSHFGSLEHLRRLIRSGMENPHNLTKYGYRILYA